MHEPDFTLSAGPTMSSLRVQQAQGRPMIFDYDPVFQERFRETERLVGELFRTEQGRRPDAGRGGARDRGGGARARRAGDEVPEPRLRRLREVVRRLAALLRGRGGRARGPLRRGARSRRRCARSSSATATSSSSRWCTRRPRRGSRTRSPRSARWRSAPARWSSPTSSRRSAAPSCRTDDWGVDICVAARRSASPARPGCRCCVVSDEAWAAIEAQPQRAPRGSFLSLLDWRETWIEGGRVKYPYTPSVSDVNGVHAAVGECLERGARRGDRPPRGRGPGLPRGRQGDGPRALAAQRGLRRQLRHRDPLPGGRRGEADARAHPRALRGDALRRLRRAHRAAVPARPHGPGGPVAVPGWSRCRRSGAGCADLGVDVDVGAGAEATLRVLSESRDERVRRCDRCCRRSSATVRRRSRRQPSCSSATATTRWPTSAAPSCFLLFKLGFADYAARDRPQGDRRAARDRAARRRAADRCRRDPPRDRAPRRPCAPSGRRWRRWSAGSATCGCGRWARSGATSASPTRTPTRPPSCSRSDAALEARRGGGEPRRIALAEFVRGPFENALEDGELLTAVLVPELAPGAAIVHRKFVLRERPAITVACHLRLRRRQATRRGAPGGRLGRSDRRACAPTAEGCSTGARSQSSTGAERGGRARRRRRRAGRGRQRLGRVQAPSGRRAQRPRGARGDR